MSVTPDKELAHSLSTASTSSSTATATAPPPLTEWVEIIEPRTKEPMYANLTTGECVWDPPPGVPVKKTNENQWWELFDQITSRFYYYNATTQQTVWHRPANCDIIPLAKLQTLKQNTQVRSLQDVDEDDSEVNAVAISGSSTQRSLKNRRENKISQTALSSNLDRLSRVKRSRPKLITSSQMQTSPVESPKSSRRHPNHHRQHSRHHSLQGVKTADENGEDIRLRTKVAKRGPDDQSTSKYYSIPHSIEATRLLASPLSKQRSSEGEQFRSLSHLNSNSQIIQQHKQSQDAASPLQISRSMSFMSGRHTSGLCSSNSSFGPSGWRASFDSGGRRSVESTPRNSRRKAQSDLPSEILKRSPLDKVFRTRIVSAQPSGKSIENPTVVEGYCTPLINRKLSVPLPTKEHSDSGISSNLGNSIQAKSKLHAKPQTSLNMNNNHQGLQQQTQTASSQATESSSQSMSISQLVDSGISAVHDRNRNDEEIGESYKTGNNNTKKLRRKELLLGAAPPTAKTSSLQMYILEQAKLSGYRLSGSDTLNGDRDSYLESGDDDGRESDDFADDEDDELSMAESSINGDDIEETDEDTRYLSEPTYNNLDPAWIHSLNKVTTLPPVGYLQNIPPPQPSPRSHYYVPNSQKNLFLTSSSQDVDAFSEEFDIRMRFGSASQNRINSNSSALPQASSTMPRPTSHSAAIMHQISSSGTQFAVPFQQNQAFPVPYEVLHPSLQRNAHSLVVDHATSAALSAAATGKVITSSSSAYIHMMADGRSTFQRGSSLSVSVSLGGGESDIEKYAQDNLNVQKKGLFRKKMTVKDILSWTEEPIRKPLTCISDKSQKKEAIETFKLVQIYMGDRKARQGMTANSVALDISMRGYSKVALRDEIYVQLCKQTNDNPKKDSLRRGWELVAICLTFFPPSATFSSCLHAYICKHRDPSLDEYHDVDKWPIHVQISHYASICTNRLERIGVGGRLAPKKPSIEEVNQSRLQIFRPSMFGGTLFETMEIQKERFPLRKLPWIFTALAEQVIRLNGLSTEGIFRVPADMEEVNSIKCRLDQWEMVLCGDCHTAASLLKLWLRELYEPLVPDDFYEDAITLGSKIESCIKNSSPELDNNLKRLFQLVDHLPDLNKLVLTYLISFLQIFARTEASSITKMDASNLATVFAPNCLRCLSNDPAVILENTRKEMAFVKSLINHLDTSGMESFQPLGWPLSNPESLK